MPEIWSAAKALRQPEKTDPAFNPVPEPGDATADGIEILLNVLTVASAVLAFSETAALGAAGNFFNLFGSILSSASSNVDEIKARINEAALRTYLDNLKSQLQGLNDNVTVLKDLDPTANAQTYKDELISLNTVVTAAMPQFQQDQYRRVAVTLFVAAASIHLGVLRRLIDVDPAALTWSNKLRAAAGAYAQWLLDTRQAIIGQRISEVGELVGASVVYIKDSFRDSRLVKGEWALVYVAPAITAAASRKDYITKTIEKFSEQSWMQDLDECALRWKQLSKLFDYAVMHQETVSGKVGTIPDNAVFPRIGIGGSYVDIAAHLAWENSRRLCIRVTQDQICVVNVPTKDEPAVWIDYLLEVVLRRVVIQSVQFPNACLRLDGSGVTRGKEGGVVNCQFITGPLEPLRLVDQGGGLVSIASTSNGLLNLRMDARYLGRAPTIVNVRHRQWADEVGPGEKFKLEKQLDGTFKIRSQDFPDAYLQMDGDGVTKWQREGSGLVYGAYRDEPNSMFHIYDAL